MFATILYAATKLIAILAIIGSIIGVFSLFPVPTFDISPAIDFINKVYTIGLHYVPGFSILWSIGIVIISIQVGYWLLRVGIFGVRMISKVFN